MVMFTERQWRVFNSMRRKYKVSLGFLKYNLSNILKLVGYYVKRLNFVLKRSAERSARNGNVIIKYNRLKRPLFDENYRKRIKRRKRNVKQWSKRMVCYLRKTEGVKEYVHIKKTAITPKNPILSEEIINQLKEQLELLKSGKRNAQLIDSVVQDNETKNQNLSMEKTDSILLDTSEELNVRAFDCEPKGEFILNEKTGVLERNFSTKPTEVNNQASELSAISKINCTQKVSKSSGNILDLLMSKVCAKTANVANGKHTTSLLNPPSTSDHDPSIDSGEEFLGFAEDENIPGMMRTPLVPSTFRSKEENAAFVSESLDEYFRENSLNRSAEIGQLVTLQSNRKICQVNTDGLMTLNCVPPAFLMPAVPESLQKLRTVAERRYFLQKFSKNIKLAIVNNEAAIYRELQRKIRQPRTKISTQQAMQAINSHMSFTRQGWKAASFLTTELNRYFFQKLFLLEENISVELHGVRGNNVNQYKTPYTSRLPTKRVYTCTTNCIDCHILKCFKTISTNTKKKLCKQPYRAIFKPCPLSEKLRQPLLDNDSDEMLLSGGSMTLVQLPTVELEVHPGTGKPLNEIAKRYLEYILPYEKITREWAEFSLSTLQIPSSKTTKNLTDARKIFSFTVPFVNDRSQILVRRVVDRSEQIDPYFLQNDSKEIYSGLSFYTNVDKKDSIQVECANVLADMINSVALSLSENSFGKIETMTTLERTSSFINTDKLKSKLKNQTKLPSVPSKTSHGTKKSRLICELRRLNATIIETNAKHQDDVRRCSKEFCKLGCVCPSLNNGYPIDSQQHCRKPKCMLQCVCKSTTPSQIIRIETDGRSITTEDAYNMRRQATARLARMEKEFTSTVVVTENETLLINETQYDKKRRCTKVPKRYQDYRDADNEFGRISPVKGCSTPLSDANDSRSSPNTTITEVISQLQAEPIYVKDTVLRQLKHCSIPIVRFKDVQNMAVWCMIHEMYKCFCGGHVLEGKRFIIEKEDEKIMTQTDDDFCNKMNFNSRAHYSFESTEEESHCSKTIRRNIAEENRVLNEKNEKKTQIMEKKDEKHNSVVKSIKNEFLKNYFKDREHLGCIRFVPVPSRTYRSINRKRSENVFSLIEQIEDKKSQLLLNEHIMRSVYYHKEKLEIDRIKNELKAKKLEKDEENVCLNKKVQPKAESGNETFGIGRNNSAETLAEALLPPRKRCFESKDGEIQPAVKKIKQSEVNLESTAKSKESQVMDDEISTEISNNLTSTEVETNKIAEKQLDMSSSSSSAVESPFSDGLKKNYNDVIKMLNNLVSRKMHDIDMALKRDSKIVPPSSENVLCVLQWKNFLGAFKEGFIYIWEVKMKTRTFLAATITDVIPWIFGAAAIRSITQTPLDSLPLIGRLIMQGETLVPTNLAVIMQGRLNYWYIKGFLQPNVSHACLRPTPETHPELTKKINTLCSSLIKQRTKEFDKKATAASLREQKQNDGALRIPSQQEENQLNTAVSVDDNQPTTKPENQNSSQFQTQANNIEVVDADKKPTKQKDWTSNIKIQNPTDLKLDSIRLPESHPYDHSWYVLDLQNDCSHIFVPTQKEIVSLDRIQRLLSLALEKQKIIRIPFLKRACFDAFIVPMSERKIYFGPFPLDATPPLLVLLQSVDGKMMTRETYEWLHKIQTKTSQTAAYWLKQSGGRIYLGGEKNQYKQIEGSQKRVIQKPKQQLANASQLNKDIEDDCVIVGSSNIQPSAMMATTTTTTTTTSLPIVKGNELPLRKLNSGFIELGLHAASAAIAKGMQATDDRSSASTSARSNFIIQTSHETNGLEIIESECMKATNDEIEIYENITLTPIEATKVTKLPSKTNLQTKSSSILVDSSSYKNLQPNRLKSVQTMDNNQQLITTLPNPHTILEIPNTVLPTIKKTVNQPCVSQTVGSNSKQQPQTEILIDSSSKSSDEQLKSTVIAASRPFTAGFVKPSVMPTMAGGKLASSGFQQTAINIPPRPNATNLNSSTSSLSVPAISSLPLLPAAAGNVMPKKLYPSSQKAIKTASPTATLTTKTFSNGAAKVSQNSHLSSNVTPILTSMKTSIATSTPISKIVTKVLPKARTTTTPMTKPATILNVTSTSPSMTTPISTPKAMPTNMKVFQVKLLNSTLNQNSMPTKAASVTNATNIAVSVSGVSSNVETCFKKVAFKSISPAKTGVVAVQRPLFQFPNNLAMNNQSKQFVSPSHVISKPALIEKPKSFTTSLPNLTSELTGIRNKVPISNQPNIAPITAVYGYMCSGHPDIPWFLTKRVNFECREEEFRIKVPGFGVAKVNGISKANNFLNQHIAKVYPQAPQNCVWTFIVRTNNNVAKMDGSNVKRLLMCQGNSATPSNTNSVASTDIKNHSPTVFQQPKQSVSNETILIDD